MSMAIAPGRPGMTEQEREEYVKSLPPHERLPWHLLDLMAREDSEDQRYTYAATLYILVR